MLDLAIQAMKMVEKNVGMDFAWIKVLGSVHKVRKIRHKQGNLKQKSSNNVQPSRTTSPTFKTPLSKVFSQTSFGKQKMEIENERLPPCLNWKCREKEGRNLIMNCNMTDEATELKPGDDYRLAKKTQIKKPSIPSMTASSTGHHSALFSASFAEAQASYKKGLLNKDQL